MNSNRAKLLRLSSQLANSLYSTRQLGPPCPRSIQVFHFSHLTHSNPVHLSAKSLTAYNLLHLHQKLFFSSKPPSFVHLVLSSGVWSKSLETELEKLNPKLTHESILYVLVNLKENPKKKLDFFKWACAKNGFDPSLQHYGLLLRSLACKEFMDDFWVVASEMKQKWPCYDHGVYSIVSEKLRLEKLQEESTKWTELCRKKTELGVVNDLPKEVKELVLGSDWDELLEGMLKKKLDFPLSEQLLVRMIGELSWQPLIALRLFEWVGNCGGFEHNGVTYNAMARVLAKKESVDEFWDFVKRMRAKGYEMDLHAYTKCVKHLPSKDAVELFEFMMDGPYKPSALECTNLLHNISRNSDMDIDLVYRLVRKFEAAGNKLTKGIYDGMHKLLCYDGRLDEANKVVAKMRIAGYEPDSITYTQEVSSLCKHGKLKEACKVLKQMEAKDCLPDKINIWTKLIEGFCVAKQMDQALSCFAKMKDKNVQPDAKMLHVLLEGFIAENKLMDAYRFLVEVVKGNLKPTQGSYNIMIDKLAEAGKFNEAVDLIRLMKQHRYSPYPDPITRYVSQHGTVDDAKKFIGVLSHDGSSVAVYTYLLKHFFEEGRYTEAEELVKASPPSVRTAKIIREMLSKARAKQPVQTPPLVTLF